MLVAIILTTWLLFESTCAKVVIHGRQNNEYSAKNKKELVEEWDAEQRRTDLLEGDIALTPEVDDMISGPQKPARDVLSVKQLLWQGKEIPYTFSSNTDDNFKAVVASAVQDFNQATCIRFIPRTNQADYIKFNVGQGCWSYVGRIGGEQEISLGIGCQRKGTALHEMMHALGFFHEHTRLDRDDWVEIHMNNIQAGMETNFQKYAHGIADYLGEPYDYGSIMHYPVTAFSSNGQQTIIILNQMAADGITIGQRQGLSDVDVRQLNKQFNCDEGAAPTPSPVTTTVVPVITTTAPVITTVKPVVTTTAAPILTTVKPVVTTTTAPIITTVKPVVTTTAAPILTTVKPVVTTTAAPITTTVKPVVITTTVSTSTTESTTVVVPENPSPSVGTSPITTNPTVNPITTIQTTKPAPDTTAHPSTTATEGPTTASPLSSTSQPTISITPYPNPQTLNPLITLHPKPTKPIDIFGGNGLGGSTGATSSPTETQMTTRPGTTTYPPWPGAFTWSWKGRPTCHCSCLNIAQVPSSNWQNNHFCVNHGQQNPGISWSTRGPIFGMRCTRIGHSASQSSTFHKGFICVRRSSPYYFKWLDSEPLQRRSLRCIKWQEPHNKKWNTGYLCGPETH